MFALTLVSVLSIEVLVFLLLLEALGFLERLEYLVSLVCNRLRLSDPYPSQKAGNEAGGIPFQVDIYPVGL